MANYATDWSCWKKVVTVGRMKLKQLVKDWLPPAAISLCQRLQGKGVAYSGDYASWQVALANSTGYDSDIILKKVSSALMKVKSGEAVFERDSVLFDKVEHSFPLLAGLLRVASENEGKLSVLDFGGSLGSTYFQCRDFLSVLPQLNWCIVEQEKFVGKGRDFFESDQLRFFYTMQESVDYIQPNVALLSSVLQYIQNPLDVIKSLISTDVQYIVIDRTPFSALSNKNWLCVQHVPSEIYQASYPCWIFSEAWFKQCLLDQFEVITDFEGSDGNGHVDGLPFQFKGMIWKRR